MPTAPTPDDAYTYRLDLMRLDGALAEFVYLDAPAPEADDTRLALNRPSWERLGRPYQVEVTITPLDRPQPVDPQR